ncbi:MAG TPA: phospho-sugar mutase [Acidimicrobiales bacterium]
MTREELHERARHWVALDPDSADRDALRDAIEGDHDATLSQWMTAAPLAFGTAGLRGPLQPGPGGMNRANVRFATLGVLGWMHETGQDASRGVIVGRDGRRNSEAFNDEVVQLLLGAGVRVYELPSPLPTPLVAYCVKALGATAGIMITASHNPPNDNGYKLYAGDGAQIIPPDDEIVERHMRAAIAAALDDPRVRDETDATLQDRSSPLHVFVSGSVLEEYRTHLVDRFGGANGGPAIAYTPLHGVGGATMTRLFEEAGYDEVCVVAAQFDPDPTFPTLPFPNPEEPGALDFAMAVAEASRSTLIIANDPDADRLGAAVRDGARWRVLRGDEIGWLLASSLIDGVHERGEMVATTIVSSTLLEKMARAREVPYATTLTGFKWISRAAGGGVLGFGYEEALGFAVDARVSDKDGMSAALALVKLARSLDLMGSSLLERLDEIEEAFGVHFTTQLSIRAQGADGLARLRERVEEITTGPPAALGECMVSDTSDLSAGFRGLRGTEGVWLQLGELGRVVVRPSGTEAKVKAYVEITPPRQGPLKDQRARARDLSDTVVAALRALLEA